MSDPIFNCFRVNTDRECRGIPTCPNNADADEKFRPRRHQVSSTEPCTFRACGEAPWNVSTHLFAHVV